VTSRETSPATFRAVHRYTPSSADVMLGMTSSLSRTQAWSGSCSPTLSQFTVGHGLPTAVTQNSYYLRGINFRSKLCRKKVICNLHKAVKRYLTKKVSTVFYSFHLVCRFVYCLIYNKLYSHNHAALKYRQKVNSYVQQR